MIKQNEALLKWEEACNELANAFLIDLYKSEVDGEDYYDDRGWVGEEIGEVLMWGDYYVDMGNIADYFRYNYTPNKFFEWYDYALEEHQNGKSPVNMKNYLKLKTTKKQALGIDLFTFLNEIL